MTSTNGKVLRFDELLGMLSDMVRNADGAEKFKAMESLRKVLAPQGQTLEPMLPEPLTAQERVERLAKLHRCCGPLESRLGLQEAFPQLGRSISAPAQLGAEHLPREAQERIARVRDLRSLYQNYPMLKRGGRPHGFPVSKGPAEKEAWARQRARTVELEQLNLASAPRGQGSVESLLAALTDVRALIGVSRATPYFRVDKTAVESTCAAVDQLLADPDAAYPALPAAPAEPAQSRPA